MIRQIKPVTMLRPTARLGMMALCVDDPHGGCGRIVEMSRLSCTVKHADGKTYAAPWHYVTLADAMPDASQVN